MLTYDLYGTKLSDLESVKLSLESLLQMEFTSHNSDYYGEYYSLSLPYGGTISIKANADAEDGEPLEDEFPEESIIVNVDDVPDASLVRDLLLGEHGHFVLLRHEEI